MTIRSYPGRLYGAPHGLCARFAGNIGRRYIFIGGAWQISWRDRVVPSKPQFRCSRIVPTERHVSGLGGFLSVVPGPAVLASLQASHSYKEKLSPLDAPRAILQEKEWYDCEGEESRHTSAVIGCPCVCFRTTLRLT